MLSALQVTPLLPRKLAWYARTFQASVHKLRQWAVREGLSYEAAMKAGTLHPAELIGLSSHGRIAPDYGRI